MTIINGLHFSYWLDNIYMGNKKNNKGGNKNVPQNK